MNDTKFCFISCVNDTDLFDRCKRCISTLHIPDGYDIEVLSVEEAESMANGYNEAAAASDAAYKIYLLQDTYIADPLFLDKLLSLFNSDHSIGVIGLSNTSLAHKYPESLDIRLIVTRHDLTWKDSLFREYGVYDIYDDSAVTKSGYRIAFYDLIPTPVFNLSFYKDEDIYSDGDIEDEILRLISENEPEDYTDAIFDNFSWPAFYYLTNIRQNILNWYPFESNSDILEIGCGLGAITGMLCDMAKSVTAVELSKRRASGALLRCRNKSNLEIIVGNLNDIQFDRKFDYITLIGVLEYQGSVSDSEHPYVDFLKKLRTLLKPGGKVLIGIENKYGLKYWCGAHEDHTTVPFDGINDYSLSGSRVRTFSKAALTELVRTSGFDHTYFYYPMPDYKLPTVIYSEKCMPTDGNMQNMVPYYIPDGNSLIADERKLWNDIVKNGTFDFFSNSFLVECTYEPPAERVTFALLNSERRSDCRIGTRFTNKGTVEKFSLHGNTAGDHLRNLIKNENDLKSRGLSVITGTITGNTIVYPYIREPLLESVVLDLISNSSLDAVLGMFDRIYSEINASSEAVSVDMNVILTSGIDVPANMDNYGVILKRAYIDLILRNAFIIDGKITWFDQEWVMDNVPANYIMYRLLKEFRYSHPETSTLVNVLYGKFGILGLIDIYDRFEKKFLDYVIDSKIWAEYCSFVPESK